MDRKRQLVIRDESSEKGGYRVVLEFKDSSGKSVAVYISRNKKETDFVKKFWEERIGESDGR